MSELKYMKLALIEASKAADRGDVPVGAVIIDSLSGEVLASSGNCIVTDNDPTAHAEMVVIRETSRKFATPRLMNCDLFVTLEPCPMCATAISFARIRRLYFGAYDPKGGGIDHGPRIFKQTTCHYSPEVVGGVDELEASVLLKNFFQNLR